jgi:hypothetical protein
MGAEPAGLAAVRVFHLGDIHAHPGERLGAGRPSLELRQVEDADAGEAAGDAGVTSMARLLLGTSGITRHGTGWCHSARRRVGFGRGIAACGRRPASGGRRSDYLVHHGYDPT